jgi:hypothetical protein
MLDMGLPYSPAVQYDRSNVCGLAAALGYFIPISSLIPVPVNIVKRFTKVNLGNPPPIPIPCKAFLRIYQDLF